MPNQQPAQPFQLPGMSPRLSAILMGGLGGIAGAFPNQSSMFGDGTQTTNQSGQQNTNFNQNQFTQGATNTQLSTLLNLLSNMSGTSTSTPVLNPAAQALVNKLSSSYGQFTKPVNLQGYQAGQIQGINTNADIASQSANAIMASRGLANSPVAATTAANIDANRISGINTLNQSLPLLANTLNLQNMGAASNFATSLPYGTSTQQQQQQTQQQAGEQTGGTSNVQGTTSSGTGYSNYDNSSTTQQRSNQTQRSGGGIGSAVGGIAAMLASLFSDERLKEDIQEIPSDKAVRKIMELKPSTWKWKGGELRDTGLIAQDVKRVLPELVHEEEHGLNKVNYAGLISTLIGAVQGINEKVEQALEA